MPPNYCQRLFNKLHVRFEYFNVRIWCRFCAVRKGQKRYIYRRKLQSADHATSCKLLLLWVMHCTICCLLQLTYYFSRVQHIIVSRSPQILFYFVFVFFSLFRVFALLSFFILWFASVFDFNFCCQIPGTTQQFDFVRFPTRVHCEMYLRQSGDVVNVYVGQWPTLRFVALGVFT